MKIYKDTGSLSGFRLEVPEGLNYPFSHVGEYNLIKDVVIPVHLHQGWEILLQVEGSTTWDFGRKQLEVNEGELLVCPPGLRHGKRRDAPEDYRIYFLGCKMDPDFARDLKPYLPLDRMTTIKQAKEIARHFRLVEEELLFDQPRQRDGVILAWKQFWLAIYRLVTNSQRRWNSEERWMAQRVRTTIEDDPGRQWSLQVMSQVMGYAPNYFAVLFKRESGISFHQYLINVRIEDAKKALQLKRENITEIALRLGFSSSQHFSRVFFQKTNVVPSRWALRKETHSP